ncbi:carbohydrate sulfotransferase 4-like [Stylophora pistillata]|nr:carbohydrate sulfotransferase 4-like [Stylophora pistillata]
MSLLIGMYKGVSTEKFHKNYQNLSQESSSTHKEKKRLNVIILTHMSSGSSFSGNIFNLHPDVFYLYEPLHDLRKVEYGEDWTPLNKTANDAYKTDFSNLLRDLFTCKFKEKKSLRRIFAEFLNVPKRLAFMYWRLLNSEITNETVKKICLAKEITVAKIMQTRLPGKIGIQELQNFCNSNGMQFNCLFIHLVRDPRAMLSSLLRRKFFIQDSRNLMFSSGNLTPEAKELVKKNAQLLCSQVVDNLNYVKQNWYDFFDRYKLVRYEDIVTDPLVNAVKFYDFVGLPMVESIHEWIVGGKQLVSATGSQFSPKIVARIDHWMSELEPSLVPLFEEACGPLMELMGYNYANDVTRAEQNDSEILITKEIPLLEELSFTKY